MWRAYVVGCRIEGNACKRNGGCWVSEQQKINVGVWEIPRTANKISAYAGGLREATARNETS